MTPELELSIERLYSIFSRYPFHSKMDGCPCCISDGDKEKLHTRQLRELEEEDISRFAFKAMTTWGDVEDFKHYLPRIFELLSTTDFIVDTFVVLGKLSYGNWTTWPKDEQDVIKEFLLSWWTDSIKNKSYFDKEAFIEIYKQLGDMEPLLNRWIITFEDNSFKNYIEFVHDYNYDLTIKNTSLKELDDKMVDRLATWIKKKKDIIEKGFFYYESKDSEFAKKISDTLYIIEHTK